MNTRTSDRTINIVCAMSPSDEMPTTPNVLVLPEGTSDATLAEAIERFPKAAIVTAVRDGDYMRAHLIVDGQNQVDYLKKGSDRRTCGTGKDPDATPVYEWNDVAIGVIVCMDIQAPAIKIPVLEKLKNSAKSIKLLCIPADMDRSWFGFFNEEITVDKQYMRVHLALSNKDWHGTNRKHNLIANSEGELIAHQSAKGPISASVPLRSH